MTTLLQHRNITVRQYNIIASVHHHNIIKAHYKRSEHTLQSSNTIIFARFRELNSLLNIYDFDSRFGRCVGLASSYLNVGADLLTLMYIFILYRLYINICIYHNITKIIYIRYIYFLHTYIQ